MRRPTPNELLTFVIALPSYVLILSPVLAGLALAVMLLRQL